MRNFGFINVEKLSKLVMGLPSSECKVFILILHYLSANNKTVFVNNAESREFLASLGYDKTTVRISSVLSSLSQNNVMKRESVGVYSVSEDLFAKTDIVTI